MISSAVPKIGLIPRKRCGSIQKTNEADSKLFVEYGRAILLKYLVPKWSILLKPRFPLYRSTLVLVLRPKRRLLPYSESPGSGSNSEQF
jgi:hypothetical protein